jgi:HPt (histidine-containing phosphotransfer) domain-containing protein
MSESQPTLNPAVIDSLRALNQDGEPDVVQEVLALFLADAPQQVDAIVRAAAAGGGEPLQRAAHTLKGAAGNIGAVRLHGICHELEHLGQARSVVGVTERVRMLLAEFAAVRDAIARLL